MENTCQVIPFPGNRTSNAHHPSSPYHLAASPEVVAPLREALPPGVLDIIDAFRGIPEDRRAALIGVAAAWSADLNTKKAALDRLWSAVTPAERFHMDYRDGKMAKLIAAIAEQEG